MVSAGVTTHGAAGFQAGCRCETCHTAETARLRWIGEAETTRWEQLNARADRVWEQRFETPEPSPYRTRWSSHEIAYALDRSRAVDDIARALGRTVDAVWQIRRKHTKRCTCGAALNVP
ncbi:hypothetical protein BST43_08415 [Mycobacteroides saopaulense]|uniref:Uncharacterized protein n=1 Tax=Mycobacteroides saopaulense TaxID=1578165 RepID=A0A1X0J9H9_9MYCO|nr:hypothetical protein BST43_08415 [Mycobacteroides saopaulense]